MFLSIQHLKKGDADLVGSKVCASLPMNNEVQKFDFVIERVGDSLVLSDNGRAAANLHPSIDRADFPHLTYQYKVYNFIIGDTLCSCVFVAPNNMANLNEYLKARVKRLADFVHAAENNIFKY